MDTTHALAPVLLSAERRVAAREMAEAHAPDSAILGALRADVYDAMGPGQDRNAVLASLQVMHPDDVTELDAYRDRGLARLYLVMYACAMSYAINERAERYREEAGHERSDFQEVSAKAASMAQFLGRTHLMVDTAQLREEASREADRFARMSSSQKRQAWLAIGSKIGLPDEMVARVGESFGLRVVAGE